MIYLTISIHLLNRESSFNMTKGDEDIESRTLKFQQPPLLAVQFFQEPPTPLLLVLKHTNFRSPGPKFFTESPFRVSKIFQSSPSISSSPSLVILIKMNFPLVHISPFLEHFRCSLCKKFSLSVILGAIQFSLYAPHLSVPLSWVT